MRALVWGTLAGTAAASEGGRLYPWASATAASDWLPWPAEATVDVEELLRRPPLRDAWAGALAGLLRREAGSREALLALIGQRADVNWNSVVEGRLTSALQVAAAYSDESLVKELVAAGADLDARQEVGATALRTVVSQKNARSIRLLITLGADVNARADDGLTPLLAALRMPVSPDAEAILFLISRREVDLTATDPAGNNAMDYAITYKKVDFLEALWSRGARPSESTYATRSAWIIQAKRLDAELSERIEAKASQLKDLEGMQKAFDLYWPAAGARSQEELDVLRHLEGLERDLRSLDESSVGSKASLDSFKHTLKVFQRLGVQATESDVLKCNVPDANEEFIKLYPGVSINTILCEPCYVGWPCNCDGPYMLSAKCDRVSGAISDRACMVRPGSTTPSFGKPPTCQAAACDVADTLGIAGVKVNCPEATLKVGETCKASCGTGYKPATPIMDVGCVTSEKPISDLPCEDREDEVRCLEDGVEIDKIAVFDRMKVSCCWASKVDATGVVSKCLKEPDVIQPWDDENVKCSPVQTYKWQDLPDCVPA